MRRQLDLMAYVPLAPLMNDYGTSAMFHEDVFHAYYRSYRPVVMPSCEFIDEHWIYPSRSACLILRKLNANHVWSIVSDGNSRDLYFTPGFHMVNMEGYLVTERAHNFEMLDFRAGWRRPFLTDIGLVREIKKLKSFLQREAS